MWDVGLWYNIYIVYRLLSLSNGLELVLMACLQMNDFCFITLPMHILCKLFSASCWLFFFTLISFNNALCTYEYKRYYHVFTNQISGNKSHVKVMRRT